MRVVLDSNILVSALLLPASPSRRSLDKALDEGKILLSSSTFEELTEVLSRPKFRRYIIEEERTLFLALLLQVAVFVEPQERINACRDPRDNKFLELAIGGKATFIISGDKDLLTLDPFRGVRIVSPAKFLSRFP